MNMIEPKLRAEPANRANNVDRYVGTRIRERRVMLGLSQQQMADMIGVTYLQAHKYERGINRISAGGFMKFRASSTSRSLFFMMALRAWMTTTSISVNACV